MASFLAKLFGGATRPTSPSLVRLADARKTNRTGFGEYADLSARFEDTKIKTPFGTYVIHHDGTFTDVANGLMWMQAYWGMTYNGKKFKGEYLQLNWIDATTLFGQGGRIPKPAGLKREDLHQYGDGSYTRGRCLVTFSGYSDWRLPTAWELLTLTFYDKSLKGYHHFSDVKARELREMLFPDCQAGSDGVWSANENGGFAWAADGHEHLGDYKKYEDRFAILFVRRSGPSAA